MPGPSRYNRKLKRKNDRRSARASRGGRTRSEAGLARSTAASGRRVSKTNRAAGRPIRSLPKSGRSPVRIDRAKSRVPRLGASARGSSQARRKARRVNPPSVLDDIGDTASGVGKAIGKFATTPVAPPTNKLTVSERADLAGIFVPGGAGILTKAPKAPKAARVIGKILGGLGKKKPPKPITPKPPKPKPKIKPKKKPPKRKERKPSPATRRKRRKAKLTDAAKKGGKRAGRAVARTPQRNPIATTGATAIAADQTGLGGSLANEIGDKTSAFVEGAVKAPINSPGKYTATTGRAILGAGAGIGQAAWALGNTGVRAVQAAADETSRIAPGQPGGIGRDYSAGEVVKPATDIAKQNIESAKKLGKKLASGDPDKVEQTFTDELGGILFIPGIATGKAITRTPGYQSARTRVRARTTRRREQRYNQRVRREREAEGGKPKKDKAGRITKNRRKGVVVRGKVVGLPERKAKPPVKDPLRPGESYALPRPIATRIRNRTTRRELSRASDRAQTTDIRRTAFDNIDLNKLVAKVPNPRGTRTQRFSEQVLAAVGVAAERGMPLGNRKQALAWIDEVEQSKTPATEAAAYAEGILPESTVLAFIRKNPEILENPNFRKAVETFDKASDELTTSQRAKYMPIAEVAGIKLPEDRIQEGIRIGDRIIRVKDMKPQQLMRKEETAKRERQKARQIEQELKRVDPTSPRRDELVAEQGEALATAEKLSQEVRDYRLAYRAAEKEFVQETEAFMAPRGLRTPTRITSVGSPDARNLEKQAIPVQRGTAVEKKRTKGILRREDRADRDPQTVISETLLRPRLQRTYHRLTKAVIAKYGVKVGVRQRDGSYRPTLEITSREARDALERGEIPPDTVLLHKQFYGPTMRDNDADYATLAEQMEIGATGKIRNSPTVTQLALDAKGNEVEISAPAVIGAKELSRLTKERLPDPGHKYIVVDRQAVKELFFQVNGIESQVLQVFTNINRLTSKVLLGYSPSFIGAQQLAEGGPAAVLAGIDPLTYTRSIKAGRENRRGELDNETRAQIDAMYGVSGGIFQLPKLSQKGKLESVADLSQPGLTAGSKTWDAMKDLVAGRAINETVLYTGAKYRRLAGRSRLDKTQRGALRSLMKFVLKHEQIVNREDLRGKSIAELERFWAKNPKLQREMAEYIEDVMGNWTALSSLEAKFAPFLAFYPYLRYSLRAGFYGWPTRHPIKTSILYFVAQLNAEELEKLVGNGRPAEWIEYAFPMTPTGPQESGGRFAPLANSIIEGLASQDANKLLRVLAPAIGWGINTATGKDGMSNLTVAETPLERILLGVAGLMAMAPPIRFANDLTGYPITRIKPRLDWKDGAVVDGERTTTSEEFRSYDPQRILRSYSIFGPLVTTPKADFKKQQKKAKRIKDKNYDPLPGYKGGSSSSGSDPLGLSGGGSSSSSSDPFGLNK